MAGKKPDYEVFVSQKNGESNYYTKVGAAWSVAKGGVSVELTPGIAVSGKFVMFPPKEGE
jgi:hypothetical protein